MGDYVVKLAKAGQNVNTCGDNGLIFSSKYPLLKVHKQGNGSQTIGSVGSTVTISHTVGVIPMFVAFTEWVDLNTGAKADHYRQFSFSDFQGLMYYFYKAWTDEDNLYLYYEDMGSDISLKYYYLIFEEPITL